MIITIAQHIINIIINIYINTIIQPRQLINQSVSQAGV